MSRKLSVFIPALAMAVAVPVPVAAEPQDGRTLLEAAVEAAGGDAWLNPGTLVLEGDAVFYGEGNTPRAIADDYRMWRVMDPDRTTSHGADGKVRITARSGTRTIFEVGYDGETTWTDKGVMPRDQADAYWASNFGFGIIRRALEPGFSVTQMPDRNIEGHPVNLVRITDPSGGQTLFGFDKESHYIRYMGFDTPKGFHERIYDGFYHPANSKWVQARDVTLYYDGVKANTVHWTSVSVGTPIDPKIFAYPGTEPQKEQ